MLALKKISKGKLIFYLTVIILMLAGTAFFAYKTYNLKYKGNKLSGLVNIIKTKENEAQNISLSQKNEKDNNFINLNTFFGKKFLNLKKTEINYKKFNIGNKNPFEPF